MNLLRCVGLFAMASFMSFEPANQAVADHNGDSLRPAACAGDWYPRERAELAKSIDDLLGRAASTQSAGQIAGTPIALICPHAGYRYSAPVMAAAYANLRGCTYKRVIVLAFSHRHAGEYHGIDVPKNLTAYATPLGEVRIDRATCDRLLGNRLFTSDPARDGGEHSLELQLPFLQQALKDFTLVPLLVGQMSERDYAEAARAISACRDDQTLLVASSDFTHFGPRFAYQPFKDDLANKLRELADQSAAPLLRADYDGFVAHLTKTDDTICGQGPIRLLLRTLAMGGGAEGVRAGFDTSGHITGDWTSSVTYQSFVFARRPGTLGKAERAECLRIARQTVAAFLRKEAAPKLDADKLPAKLRADGACFVTLQNHGELRGCIGNMVADGPLYESVIRDATLACQDSRFVDHPVTAAELDQLHIEISYLTPMKKVASFDEIVIGRHGLHISLGGQRGVLLPQVAYEYGWTREEFLTQVCHKAGLPPDAWKRPQAELHSFEAEVFGEPK
jgi:MEMO1 family protein